MSQEHFRKLASLSIRAYGAVEMGRLAAHRQQEDELLKAASRALAAHFGPGMEKEALNIAGGLQAASRAIRGAGSAIARGRNVVEPTARAPGAVGNFFRSLVGRGRTVAGPSAAESLRSGRVGFGGPKPRTTQAAPGFQMATRAPAAPVAPPPVRPAVRATPMAPRSAAPQQLDLFPPGATPRRAPQQLDLFPPTRGAPQQLDLFPPNVATTRGAPRPQTPRGAPRAQPPRGAPTPQAPTVAPQVPAAPPAAPVTPQAPIATPVTPQAPAAPPVAPQAPAATTAAPQAPAAALQAPAAAPQAPAAAPPAAPPAANRPLLSTKQKLLLGLGGTAVAGTYLTGKALDAGSRFLTPQAPGTAYQYGMGGPQYYMNPSGM
jgi:hypothetical protein